MEKKTERQEFAASILSHWQLLRRRALRLERSTAAADDLVQDTVERALTGFDGFAPRTNIVGWLLRIMSNLFIDRCRRRAHEVSLGVWQASEIVAPDPELPEAWESVSMKQVKTVIPRLCPELRTAMTLYLQGTHSYRQMSDTLGVSTNTVGSRLFRARNKIRTLLEPVESERRTAME